MFALILSPLISSAQIHADVASLLQQFDQELESTTAWSLETSPAYRKLRAIHGDLPLKDAAELTTHYAPGTGRGGYITGSEFPKNTWALTFDDGPHKTDTAKILNFLSAFKIKATFFWLAENVVKYGSIVTLVEDSGHSPQNHSYTHADLSKATDLALGYEISVANQVLKDHYEEDPRFFRLPYGAGNSVAKIRTLIAREKLISVLWNVDSLDWADPNPASVANRVNKQMLKVGHGIVLFHDIHAHSADAATLALNMVKRLPYRYVTIPAIVDEMNGL